MVALCRSHHDQADAGAFTNEKLREFKQRGRDRAAPLGARFNWMRQQLVAVVGGNFYVDTLVAVQVRYMPVVWFGRDEQDNVLVNLQQLTTSGELRMVMIENFWLTEGSAEHDIDCPPMGRLVKASYPNGDRLKVEFRAHGSWDEFERRYAPMAPSEMPMPPLRADMPAEHKEAVRRHRDEIASRPVEPPRFREYAEQIGLAMPLTTVEVEMTIAGTELKLGPRSMTLPGMSVITGCWMSNCRVGVQID